MIGQTRSGASAARISASNVRGPASSRASISVVIDADVGGAFFGAFVDGAHAVADFQADVPQEREERSSSRARRRRRARRQQDQDVDVGVRMQLAAAVAAHGQQRQLARSPRAAASARRSRRMTSMNARARAPAPRPFVGEEALRRAPSLRFA